MYSVCLKLLGLRVKLIAVHLCQNRHQYPFCRHTLCLIEVYNLLFILCRNRFGLVVCKSQVFISNIEA